MLSKQRIYKIFTRTGAVIVVVRTRSNYINLHHEINGFYPLLGLTRIPNFHVQLKPGYGKLISELFPVLHVRFCKSKQAQFLTPSIIRNSS
jgi:hypothetical protein